MILGVFIPQVSRVGWPLHVWAFALMVAISCGSALAADPSTSVDTGVAIALAQPDHVLPAAKLVTSEKEVGHSAPLAAKPSIIATSWLFPAVDPTPAVVSVPRTVTPEETVRRPDGPSSLALLSVGLGFLFIVRRRYRLR